MINSQIIHILIKESMQGKGNIIYIKKFIKNYKWKV